MKKITKLMYCDSFRYLIVLFPIFLGVLIYNILTPLYADDYNYIYSFNTGEKIEGVFDIFPSMYSHYFTMNGRLVLHFIAQVLLMLGNNIANLINSFAFVILGLLAYYHVFLSFKNVRCLSLVFIYFCIFMLTPDFGQSYLWITGASNYLYGPMLFLIFLLPYRSNLDNTHKKSILISILSAVLIFVIGILVGDTNENTAVTAVFIAIVYFIYRLVKYKNVQVWAVLGLIGAIVSTCFNLFSPGTHNRLGGQKINLFPVKELLLHFFEFFELFAPILLILMVLLIVYITGCFKNKKGIVSKADIKKFLFDIRVELFYLIVFLISYFSLVVVSAPLRTLSGSLVYLIIIVLCFYEKCKEYISNIKFTNVFVLISITAIFIGCYCHNFMVLKVVHNQYQNRVELINSAKENDETVVSLPTIYGIGKYSCYKYYGDLSADSNSWENKGVAYYYDFDKVILDTENVVNYFS